MRTVLDLVGEFSALNDAKVQWGGRLPPDAETRWRELKEFYDLLMAQGNMAARPITRRFSFEDIATALTARKRLRVPLETDMLFKVRDEFQTGLAVNVSQGGIFLSSDRLLEPKSNLTVYVANPRSHHEALVETDAEVAWVTERGLGNALPPGMGIRFLAEPDFLERHMDAMVVDALVRHLSGLDANALAPEFILREQLDL